MQQLVRDMRIGSKIILGRYSCNKDADPQPIVWLKATLDSVFIAQDALDYICFDARELRENPTTYNRYQNGGTSYTNSNIHTYLNSDADEWYVARHRLDMPPIRETTYGYGATGDYSSHPGFLRHFEEYEISSIITDTVMVSGETVDTKVRLPLSHEVVGDSRFMLFNRKGVRAHPSEDLVREKGRWTAFDSTSRYIPYVMADRHERFPACIYQMDAGCYLNSTYPEGSNGIRPVIKLDPCAKVDMIEKNIYELVPFGASQIDVWSGDDFMSLLGLV